MGGGIMPLSVPRVRSLVRRIGKLAFGLGAGLLFAVLTPIYFADRRSEDSFAISSVIAAPRDLQVLTVPVRLSGTPDLTLARGVIYDYGTSVPAAGTPASQVLLDGPVFTLNVAGLHALPPAAHSESSDDGAGDELVSPLVQRIGALGYDLITIRRGTLNVTMLDGSVETLSDIQAELKKTRRGQIAALGSFTVRGQRLAFDATLGQPDKAQPSRWPLQVSFSANLLKGSFDGYADLGDDLQLSGQTELSIASLRRVGRWFGLPLYPTEGFNATKIKADLTWARRSLAFEKAQISVDGNEGNGRLVLNVGSDRPLIEATLDFAALNLTPYVDAARSQFFGFDLPVTWGTSFDVSLPMIRHLDADMRISAHRVTLKDYTFGQGGATITAQGGKLHADIAGLELPSGSLSAQVTAIMSEGTPRYALRAKIENMETGAASARLLGAAALSGLATLDLDLTSTGYSLTEIAKRLSGKAALSMPEGGRIALDLPAVRQAAKGRVHDWATLAKSHTNVQKLEARALIIDGVAFAEEAQARAGDVALALAGRFGLVDGNMDARVFMRSNLPPDEPLKPTDSGTETVTVRGPWPDPVLHGEDGDASRDGRAP
jgi:AsmA protein